MIKKEQTGQERATLPRYPDESWIALYHQLLLLRKPIIFDHLVGRFAQYVDGDKSRVILSAYPYTAESAVSDHIMRAGKHYVEVLTRSDICPRGCNATRGKLFCEPPSDIKLQIVRSNLFRWLPFPKVSWREEREVGG